MKIIFVLVIINLVLVPVLLKKVGIEVSEDFELNIDYNVSSSNTWEARGVIKFSQKGVKGGKLNYVIENNELSKNIITKLKQSCVEDGEYTLRTKINDSYYYSSVHTVRYYTICIFYIFYYVRVFISNYTKLVCFV
jgi:hypothetical protein